MRGPGIGKRTLLQAYAGAGASRIHGPELWTVIPRTGAGVGLSAFRSISYSCTQAAFRLLVWLAQPRSAGDVVEAGSTEAM